MKKMNGYYVGQSEGRWYAVPAKRYEAESSPEKGKPEFWKRQFDDLSNGGYHPLGGIGQALDRTTILQVIS